MALVYFYTIDLLFKYFIKNHIYYLNAFDLKRSQITLETKTITTKQKSAQSAFTTQKFFVKKTALRKHRKTQF